MSVFVDICVQLGDFNLDVKFESSSKRIGIVGKSGAGKSVLLRCIAGIEDVKSGIIRIDDRVLYDKANNVNVPAQKRNIGYLFQNYALFPNMTVGQNIAAGIKLNKTQREQRTKEMISKFHLEGFENHLPSQLSGGQQQRTALARIMAHEPEVILLDEPFSAIDEELKSELYAELQSMLNDYNGTVIMVSHDKNEIYRFCDEYFIVGEEVDSVSSVPLVANKVEIADSSSNVARAITDSLLRTGYILSKADISEINISEDGQNISVKLTDRRNNI